MSSFVGRMSATSELDLTNNYHNNFNSSKLNRKKSNLSLKSISMFSKNDKPIDDFSKQAPIVDPEWESRHKLLASRSKSASMRSLNLPTTPQSPDYRTLLMMKRPMSKLSRRYSDNDSGDSMDSDDDYGDELLQHDDVTATLSRTSNASSNSSASSFFTEQAANATIFEEEVVTSQSDKYPADLEDNRALLKIAVTEQKLTKCLRLDVAETVWTAKQRIIQSLAKKLSDAINYGIYCKKLGRFLLDHKPLLEYVEAGSVSSYELRYKRRVFHQMLKSPKESRNLLKMQSAAKRKELMTYVRQRNTEKIHAMIRKGIDPNFHATSSDDTPLTLASTGSTQNNVTNDRTCSPVIMALVGGGAHLDFRNRRGFTPLHTAARTGNVSALKTLLDLGASPDAIDNKELSSVYHCALMGSNVECLRVLLQHKAKLFGVDSQGWTLLHQICRYGRFDHLQLILTSPDANIEFLNTKNATGNTPVHVCALYNQDNCVKLLLQQGALPTMRNFANQDAYEVAVLAGNVAIAELIKDFQRPPNKIQDNLSLMKSAPLPPQADPSAVLEGNTSPTRPSTLSISSNERYDSNLPPNAKLPNQANQPPPRDYNRPVTLTEFRPIRDNHVKEESFSTPASEESFELLFIVCKDYEAENEKQISLTVGDLVTVSSEPQSDVIEGYCFGKNGSEEGIFPLDCVQAVKLRKNKNDTASLISEELETEKRKKSEDNCRLSSNSDMISTSQPNIYHQILDVVLKKGAEGYGFVLRGAKSEGPIERFASTPQHPALQYLESVEVGSNAHKVGLRAGHYIVKINSKDVSCVGHREIVDTIRCAGDPLRMRVVNVVDKRTVANSRAIPNDDTHSLSSSTTSSDVTSSVKRRPGGHARTASIGSAIGKLDSVLAMEESSDEVEENTATLRRRPVSRRIRTQDLQEIFQRQEARNNAGSGSGNAPNSPPVPRETQSLSAATSRRLIRVLPPKLPTGGEEVIVEQEFDDVGDVSPTYPTHPINPVNPVSKPPIPSSFGHNKMKSDSMIDPVTSQPKTIGPSMSRYTSSPALPVMSRKPPPAPPQRRNSRLSMKEGNAPTSGTSFARTPSPTPAPTTTANNQFTAYPNTRSNTPSIKPPLRPDVASAAAFAAQQRKASSSFAGDSPKVTTPTSPKGPSVAPKPKPEVNKPLIPNGDSSALALALAAKRQSLKTAPGGGKQSSTTRVIRPFASNQNQLKSEISTSDKTENFPLPPNLPPPPPTPPSGVSDNSKFILPPPPTYQTSDDARLDDVSNLPPPPDAMLAPPPSFAESSTAPSPPGLAPPNRFRDSLSVPSNETNGIDNASNADSGVDDVGPRDVGSRHSSQQEQNKIETLSVVSTISSEDGSDAGVSLGFDSKSTENKNHVTTKVQFGGLPAPLIHPKPVKAPSKNTPAPVKSTGFKSKSLTSWSVGDVSDWLRHLSLDQYVEAFAENEIDGSHLPDLGKDELGELGVKRIGHRLSIEKSLKKFQN